MPPTRQPSTPTPPPVVQHDTLHYTLSAAAVAEEEEEEAEQNEELEDEEEDADEQAAYESVYGKPPHGGHWLPPGVQSWSELEADAAQAPRSQGGAGLSSPAAAVAIQHSSHHGKQRGGLSCDNALLLADLASSTGEASAWLRTVGWLALQSLNHLSSHFFISV